MVSKVGETLKFKSAENVLPNSDSLGGVLLLASQLLNCVANEVELREVAAKAVSKGSDVRERRAPLPSPMSGVLSFLP